MRKLNDIAAFQFRANEALEIEFPTFSVRIVFHDTKQLTVTVVEGDNAGFTDKVDYSAISLRDGIVVLSWQEHIGSTIVHVLDLTNDYACTFVTPAHGKFLRISGKLRNTVR